MNQDINKKKPISTLFAIIGTLIVERITMPYLEAALGWLSSKEFWLTNLLYRRIAEGFMVNIPFYIFLLLALLMSLYFLDSVPNSESDKSEEKCSSCKDKNCNNCWYMLTKILRNKINAFLDSIPKSLILVSLWMAVIMFLTATNFVNHRMMKTRNNIEIVAYYIDDNQYKHLNSLFYQMDEYDDYYELTEEINHIANKAGVLLQK